MRAQLPLGAILIWVACPALRGHGDVLTLFPPRARTDSSIAGDCEMSIVWLQAMLILWAGLLLEAMMISEPVLPPGAISAAARV